MTSRTPQALRPGAAKRAGTPGQTVKTVNVITRRAEPLPGVAASWRMMDE